ncbi:PilZ domain-containing protein [Novosphingobium sp.]|uniref:PilZ domain-containing protein n=1 Tax=Novosphingobium sp. TaxID=1874826 RepID=UPI00345C52DD
MTAAGAGGVTGRRGQSRLRVRLPCRLISCAADQAAWLIDLSASGARVYSKATFALRGDVVLQWSGKETFGTIVWARVGYCGIRFFDSLPESWVLEARGLCSASPARDERAAARTLAREWVTGARRI